MKKTVAIAISLLSILSCSVLEPREGCPTILHIDNTDILNKMPEGSITTAVMQSTYPEYLYREDEYPCDTLNDFVMQIVREDYQVSGISTTSLVQASPVSFTYIVTNDHECDSVYAYSLSTVVNKARANDVYEKPEFSKQFATVTLRRVDANPEEPEEFFGLNMTVRSRWIGLDVPTLSPIDGEGAHYSYKVGKDKRGIYRFRIIRQGDNSLTLTFSGKGMVSKALNLGKYLEAMGYDWRARNLKDVVLYIDLYNSTCGIEIEDWTVQVVTYNF